MSAAPEPTPLTSMPTLVNVPSFSVTADVLALSPIPAAAATALSALHKAARGDLDTLAMGTAALSDDVRRVQKELAEAMEDAFIDTILALPVLTSPAVCCRPSAPPPPPPTRWTSPPSCGGQQQALRQCHRHRRGDERPRSSRRRHVLAHHRARGDGSIRPARSKCSSLRPGSDDSVAKRQQLATGLTVPVAFAYQYPAPPPAPDYAAPTLALPAPPPAVGGYPAPPMPPAVVPCPPTSAAPQVKPDRARLAHLGPMLWSGNFHAAPLNLILGSNTMRNVRFTLRKGADDHTALLTFEAES
ncbi:hypothetical protein C8J57DRAFT_1226208 [Mycena rebaudengoi]|nr:hypothetical protein C8J57DRAFT_1226208 [Mycena rebaudengoi]